MKKSIQEQLELYNQLSQADKDKCIKAATEAKAWMKSTLGERAANKIWFDTIETTQRFMKSCPGPGRRKLAIVNMRKL